MPKVPLNKKKKSEMFVHKKTPAIFFRLQHDGLWGTGTGTGEGEGGEKHPLDADEKKEKDGS